MMKPHETTLTLKFNSGNACLVTEEGEIVAYVPIAEWQPLFKAASVVVRSLMRLYNALEASGEGAAEEVAEASLEAGNLLHDLGVLT